jgi:hypothetical protein
MQGLRVVSVLTGCEIPLIDGKLMFKCTFLYTNVYIKLCYSIGLKVCWKDGNDGNKER